ncbi:hypothetical protein ElyMa_002064100 [Elysia marginata]|uniref:Uncharacterized protein n=1 Tax=Elysia marginata TaxID=1093978 RepID=A0AAV4FBP3_9GAST|nr:hypothetical protein ElyMa_002064100 [Elysia marginata]
MVYLRLLQAQQSVPKPIIPTPAKRQKVADYVRLKRVGHHLETMPKQRRCSHCGKKVNLISWFEAAGNGSVSIAKEGSSTGGGQCMNGLLAPTAASSATDTFNGAKLMKLTDERTKIVVREC